MILTSPPPGRSRRRTPLAALAAVAALALVGFTPGTALAGGTPCPPGAIRGAVAAAPNGTFIPHIPYYLYSLVSAQPTFLVSDSRSVTNQTAAPASVTFTSQVSRTFSITTSAGTQASLFSFLTVSVSGSITQSRTTAIGVSVTANVSAGGRLLGEYGVEAVQATYDVTQYVSFAGNCSYVSGPTRETTVAPTTVEGWRLSGG